MRLSVCGHAAVMQCMYACMHVGMYVCMCMHLEVYMCMYVVMVVCIYDRNHARNGLMDTLIDVYCVYIVLYWCDVCSSFKLSRQLA